MSARIWFSTAQAAEHVGMHVKTILAAAGSGELHGSQRKAPQGRWRFHIDCLDAWVAGTKCSHQEAGAA